MVDKDEDAEYERSVEMYKLKKLINNLDSLKG